MRRIILLVVFCCWMTALPAAAQESDTTQTPAPPDSLLQQLPTDSLAVAPPDTLLGPAIPDSTEIRPPRPMFPFPVQGEGRVLTDSLPTRTWVLDGTDLLQDVPGSFTYDFGAAGWLDGWSPYTLDPNRIDLTLEGIPFQDVLTGRPLFEMLPWPVLNPLALDNAQNGSNLGVEGWLRAYDQSQPLTEARYQSSNNSLMSAYITHSQSRQMKLFGQQARIGFMLTYGGHGAEGEYTGNRLRNSRQVFFRVRLQHPLVNLEVLEMSNRRRVGAHGGIQQIGDNYNTIYNRFSAQAETPDARRENQRNDLMVTAHRPLFGLKEPLTISGYWTSQIGRYFTSNDTLDARTSRLGFRIHQSIPYGAGAFSLTAEGGREKVLRSNVLPDTLNLERSDLHLTARNSMKLGPVEIDLQAGLHDNSFHRYTAGEGHITIFNHFYAEAIRSGQPISWIEEFGYRDFMILDEDIRTPTITRIGAGFRGSLGPIDLDVKAFRAERTEAPGFYATPLSDLLEVISVESVKWAGVTATLGFRRFKARGFYLSISPTGYQMQNPNVGEYHRREALALPGTYVTGRMGLRYLLFKRDLDMDLYTRARYWAPFQGRTLHPQTGLLVVQQEESREIASSAVVDVVLEAGIRTAKLFVSFENVLSGTSVYIGNLLVPDYPLPQRRFRFGVYWPIFD